MYMCKHHWRQWCAVRRNRHDGRVTARPQRERLRNQNDVSERRRKRKKSTQREQVEKVQT